MARQSVQSTAQTGTEPDQVWSVVRDFCAPWHPAIATMQPERGDNGALIRRFSVQGEDTVYRERLTYFSDSDREMAYTHLSGIEGIDRYDAKLRVDPNGAVTMSAQVDAPDGRAQKVATGTQAIFDAGTKAITQYASTAKRFSYAAGSLDDIKYNVHSIDLKPNIAFDLVGTPSETLCLFLHGIGGNRTNWAAQHGVVQPYCASAALDLRGYGGSALGSAQSTVEDYCVDILRVMEACKAQKLVLCGLSYGAWIATSFAQRHPEKLTGLVLAGGCTGMSEADQTEREAFRQAREVPMSQGQTPADFGPAVVDAIAGPNATEAVRRSLLRSMQEIPVDTYSDALRCFVNPLEKINLSRLNMPVLMMTGAHDRLAPSEEIRAVAQRIVQATHQPDVRFEVIADAGHVCNLERPEIFNAILAEFLERVVS